MQSLAAIRRSPELCYRSTTNAHLVPCHLKYLVCTDGVREKIMGCRSYPSVLVLALGMGLAGGMSDAWSQTVDFGKYPDFTGRWNRSEVYQWARGEKPPLTPEYQ